MLNMAEMLFNDTAPTTGLSTHASSEPDNTTSQNTSGQMDRLVYVVEAHIEPMIYAFGIITNILNFIIIRKMSIAKVIKTLLLTLSITDLLASVAGFLNILLEIVIFKGDMPYGIWVSGAVEIFFTYKLFLMFLGMSSAIVIFIAIVRTYSMVNPFEWKTKFKYTRVVKIIIIIIVSTVIIFIPSLLYVMWKACFEYENPDNIEEIPGDSQVCVSFFMIFPHAGKVRYYFFVIALLLGPGTVLANLVCFVLLKRAISQSLKELNSMQQPGVVEIHHTEQQSRKNVRINRMFMYVLVFNTVCILPSFVQIVFLIIDPHKLLFDKTDLRVAISDIVAEVFIGALPCYNFWTYIIINKDFRRKFKQLIFCRKKKSESSSTDTTGRTPQPSPRPERLYIGTDMGDHV